MSNDSEGLRPIGEIIDAVLEDIRIRKERQDRNRLKPRRLTEEEIEQIRLREEPRYNSLPLVVTDEQLLAAMPLSFHIEQERQRLAYLERCEQEEDYEN